MTHTYKDIYSIFETPVIIAKAFASEFKKITDKFISSNGNINIALSGGNTPKLLFSVLAEEYLDIILWSKINFYWADERCVPPESSESNYGEADRILFSKINLTENVHRIAGENDPSAEAERYSELLKHNLPFEYDLPKFDLMLLGMGEDGHTASIFPDSMNLLKSEKFCETAVHPESNQKRITLTGKVINNSERIYFIVTGKNKERVVKIISERKEDGLMYPAGNIKQKNGDVNWFLDQDAAGLIIE